MLWVWYIDRGSGLAAYVALWFATLTGILYNARSFGFWQRASNRIHVAASVVATAALIVHSGVGLVDMEQRRRRCV
ncbi:MAG: hypothetical protein ACYDDF_14590, partial [Thermoplasmatota archaeon]